MSARVDWRYCTGASPAPPKVYGAPDGIVTFSPEMRAGAFADWLATFMATHRASSRRVVGLASDASNATYRPVQSGWGHTEMKGPFVT